MSSKAAIITAFDPYRRSGGIETYTCHLIRLLKNRGIDVDVYHTGMVRAVEGSPVFNNKLIGDIIALGEMFLEQDYKYDFAISNSYYGVGYFPPKIPNFNVFHSSYSGYVNRYKNSLSENYGLMLEEITERASGFGKIKIAVSEKVRDELIETHGFSDVRIVHNSVDTELFRRLDKKKAREDLGIPSDAYVGIFVGRWENSKKKGIIERVIKAADNVNWLLVLASGGDECDLANLPNVVMRKNVSYRDMPFMYNAADFMLFPSEYEGFGMAIIEAISCGVPVISTPVGIASLLFREKPFNKLLLQEADVIEENGVADIVEKIDFLRNNPDAVNEISNAGIVSVNERFSIRLWMENMAEALEI